MKSSQYKRREFLTLLAQASLVALVPWSQVEAAPAFSEELFRHPRPQDPTWPPAAEWESLKAEVGGRLVKPATPPASQNPYFLQEQVGATQSAGWQDAWKAEPSVWAVTATSAEDVSAAVLFAKKHKLRLVVKGAGHDYLGRSSGADALLIWTHKMRKTESHDVFLPQGAPSGHKPQTAISVGAGTRWVEAYTEATTKNGRYVQGGGCTSVGAAGGFTLGGGFGSFSKKFGTGSAGILEAEVVTADGKILVVNEFHHPELFWALKGGGAGAFGVVTRLTLETHTLPSHFAVTSGSIRAKSDAAYRSLIEKMCQFYLEKLNNEHWGEQFAFRQDNSVEFLLMAQGFDRTTIDDNWKELEEWLRTNDCELTRTTFMIPPRQMWDKNFWLKEHPEFLTPDPREEGDGYFWWTPNQAEVGRFWYAYQSRYIPLRLFKNESRPEFVDTIFKASRIRTVSFHINKGLAGCSEEALERTRNTSGNPGALEAAALLIMNAGVKGAEPDSDDARKAREQTDQAINLFRDLAPNIGTYGNEADFFTENWQEEFWGSNYPRLLAIKKAYDPDGLFHCHQSVGSEGWSKDQMTKRL